MIIGQIGMQPYLNVPLQNNSVNDISVTPKNPSNNSVTSATGIFGQSNGAMNWDNGNDYLSWATSIAQEVATYLSSNCSIVYFMIRNSFVTGSNNFLSGYENSNNYYQVGVGESTNNRTSFNTRNTTLTQNFYNNTTSTGSWFFYALVIEPYDSTEVSIKFLKDSAEEGVDTGTGRLIKVNTTANYNTLRLGNVSFASNAGFRANVMGFRIYPATLNSLQTQIINAQMGRIAA
jgi:hypothetical protein